jgi:hypothetical protein
MIVSSVDNRCQLAHRCSATCTGQKAAGFAPAAARPGKPGAGDERHHEETDRSPEETEP